MVGLKKAAKEHGIDLDNLPDDPAFEQRQEQNKKLTDEHPLCALSWKYATSAMEWIENNDEVAEKKKEIIEHAELGTIPHEQLHNLAGSLKDCFEVIQWYLHFIHVKLKRAVHGKLEDEEWDEENDFQTDYNGAAKIAKNCH